MVIGFQWGRKGLREFDEPMTSSIIRLRAQLNRLMMPIMNIIDTQDMW